MAAVHIDAYFDSCQTIDEGEDEEDDASIPNMDEN